MESKSNRHLPCSSFSHLPHMWQAHLCCIGLSRHLQMPHVKEQPIRMSVVFIARDGRTHPGSEHLLWKAPGGKEIPKFFGSYQTCCQIIQHSYTLYVIIYLCSSYRGVIAANKKCGWNNQASNILTPLDYVERTTAITTVDHSSIITQEFTSEEKILNFPPQEGDSNYKDDSGVSKHLGRFWSMIS